MREIVSQRVGMTGFRLEDRTRGQQPEADAGANVGNSAARRARPRCGGLLGRISPSAVSLIWYATCVLFLAQKLRKRAKKGWVPMVVTAPPIICCPVCDAHGAILRHDIRASLVYTCQTCMHEWQIDAADEPPQADSMVAESPRTPSARGTPMR